MAVDIRMIAAASGWSQARRIAQDEAGIVDVAECSSCADRTLDGTRVPSE